MSPPEKRTEAIKVLVVDDSLFMRNLISDMLTEEPGITIAGTAQNGLEALKKIAELKPDVVTLDLQMPVMDGQTTLKNIMKENPTPVVMVSAFTKKDADVTLDCLRNGAVDFVEKPSGPVSMDINAVKDLLIAKVRTAAKAKTKKPAEARTTPNKNIAPSKTIKKAVVIGASTGGPSALEEVLAKIPADLPAIILVVQHMPKIFITSLAERLSKNCAISVKEGEEGESPKAGTAYLAPGERHMLVQKKAGNTSITLMDTPPVNGTKPSIDTTMESASAAFGKNTIGVILTGMGSDGKEGMARIKKQGGKTICQDKSTSVVFDMPNSTIKSGNADHILPIGSIADEITKLVQE